MIPIWVLMIMSQQYTALSHVAELIRDPAGRYPLRPVRADLSEQTELSGYEDRGAAAV